MATIKFFVQGRVMSSAHAGVGGLRVEIVDRNVAADKRLAQATSDAMGRFEAAFDFAGRGKPRPDLQARAFAKDRLVGESAVRFNAAPRETLDITLEESAAPWLASEHEALSRSLAEHFKGRLRNLRETDEHPDISYLAGKSGWDARAVAMAALADEFSQRTGGKVPAAAFYAWFRAGLPANEEAIYNAEARTLEAALKQAIDAGVVEKRLAREIPGVMKELQALSAAKLLANPAIAGISSLKEMLGVSGLNGAKQKQFAELLATHRGDTPAFWSAARKAFGKLAERLQVDGKLAVLTLNNAPLMRKLHASVGSSGIGDALQLAQRGLHRPEAWNALLGGDVPVPKEIPGKTVAEERANYAAYLAAQVRLAYPTASIAEMVASRDLKLLDADGKPAPAAVIENVHAFLTAHQGRFEIGMQPVERYVKRNKISIPAATLSQVKRLQRVYQITPGDRAMAGLLARGVDAAYHVVRYPKETFIREFAADLGGAEQAALTYERSVQVHNAVLHVAMSYLTASQAPPIGVHSDPAIIAPAPTAPYADDVIAYATLESLLGEMDYCECEHCRSILSPAAYLVDLLQFIDQPIHPEDRENPQNVLLQRRPDIKHLPLTCENTNTAMPYIDVVNETLEYFVANTTRAFSLTDYEGHDTGGARTEDLLANPLFVMDSAYATLREAPFPAPLPFHQPLEKLRRLFGKFDTRLAEVMEQLRGTEELERGANPYAWRDILNEEIGLSRAEAAILTTSATGEVLAPLYGYTPGTTDAAIIGGDAAARIDPLANAKNFARRIDITYANLVEILATRFVNPGSDLLPRLQRLGVPFAELQRLKDTNTAAADAAFDALLPTGAAAPDPADYGGDIKAWVRDDANFDRIMALLTLTDPTGTSDACDFDLLELRFARPMSAADDDSTRLGAVEYARLLRFVRLWRKLGWTIAQTDAAICALWRADLAPLGAGNIDTVAKLDAGFLRLLPRLGVVVRAMRALELTPERDLASLLACWSPLSAPDEGPLSKSGWLARKLGISVRELQLLISFTGLDPFAPPDPTAPAILRLAALVKDLRSSALGSAGALYLLWNHDLSGRSAPDAAQVTELARALRGDFAQIDDQFAPTEDPGGDVARARMALAYGQEATDAFFALIDDTLALDVAYTHPAAALEPAITARDARISYDGFRHRLAYRGVLTAPRQAALTAVAAAPAEFRRAVDALFARSEDVQGSFFTRYPELQPLYAAYIASTDPPAARRRALLAAFRPELSRRRKRQQALQRISATAVLDPAFARALLDAPASPYPLHAAADRTRPALDDALALENGGLARTTPPGSSTPATWRGSIETPATGFHNFVIETDATAVTLEIDGVERPLTRNAAIWRNNGPLELAAGTLYEIVITAEGEAEPLSLKWETPTREREVVPARYLYPPGILEPFSLAHVRFLKAASLAKALKLSASELAHFATHPDDRIAGDGWLNVLPVSGPAEDATARALRAPLQDLLDYSRTKSELSIADDALLAILRDPTAAAAGAEGPLYALTRWDAASLAALLARFRATIADLGHIVTLRRVQDVFVLLRKLGISAEALIAAATGEPSGDTVRVLESALRERYDPADWRSVIQPVNDAMRALQRDALVAYILHGMRSDRDTEHIDTADKLFEYFLMDVQMEPCMQTSRVRHALSSVQLFIERCLMNLETRVAPASIDAKQWEWMKRYRVWEANRKVFLYPENWLEPELRDDKSPFFKEIESELLQSDVTEESAATALLNYLAKLEDVAKLEPCGIHHVPGDAALRTGDVDHVIARTSGAKRAYYYRRREYGSWTPWEQAKLDIEDNPVVPVVWKGRLLLFWMRIVQQPAETSAPAPDVTLGEGMQASSAVNRATMDASVRAILCWSEYYNGKWQPAKSSDPDRPTELGRFAPGAFDRASFRIMTADKSEFLFVTITRPGVYRPANSSSFVLYNTHSAPVRGEDAAGIYRGYFTEYPRKVDVSGTTLDVAYAHDAGFGRPAFSSRTILQGSAQDAAAEPTEAIVNAWQAPFFYHDRRHAYFVTTTQAPRWIGAELPYGLIGVSGAHVTKEIPPLVITPHTPGRPVDDDAYIRIAGTTEVIYGERRIGPAGAIPAAVLELEES